MNNDCFPPNHSTLNALATILEAPDLHSYQQYRHAYNGMLLEVAATTACIVASHKKGFYGMSIAEWLPLFFQELNFQDIFRNPNKLTCSLLDSDEFIQDFSDIHIPYFCPQVSGKFSTEIREKIERIHEQPKLGSVFSNKGAENKSRDFHFKDIKGHCFLNGECKLRKESFGRPDLTEVIQKFNTLPESDQADIQIIVARKLIKLTDWNFPENYSIYKAVYDTKSESGINDYSLVKITRRNIVPDSSQRKVETDLSSETPISRSSSCPKDQDMADSSSKFKVTESPQETNRCPKKIILVGLAEIASDSKIFEAKIGKFKC